MSGTEGRPPSGNTGVNSPGVEEAWTGIDWVTAFCSKDWSEDTWPDFDVLEELVTTQYGAPESAWAKQGFLGVRHGQVAAGERRDGTLREITGVSANRYSEMVGENYHLLRPSRLDVAFTFRLRVRQQGIAKSYFSTVSSSHGARCRPRERSLYTSSGGGETLYIGSKSSDRRIRLYDKDAEQGGREPYERTWRLELQYRRAPARDVWAAYHDSKDKLRTLRGFLASECEREGILDFIDWDCDAVELAAHERAAPVLEQRLDWLSKQVSPTVRELTKAGYGPAVLRALGLDDLADSL